MPTTMHMHSYFDIKNESIIFARRKVKGSFIDETYLVSMLNGLYAEGRKEQKKVRF